MDAIEPSGLDEAVRAVGAGRVRSRFRFLYPKQRPALLFPLSIHPPMIGITGMSRGRRFRMLTSGPDSKAGSKSKGDTTP